MSSNNVGHLITSTIITVQHFATLHQITLHFLSFTLHYPLIWLNPFTFPIVLFPLTSLNQTQHGYHIPKLISKIMNLFTALKNLSPFHVTFFSSLSLSVFTYLPTYLSYQPFTSLYFAVHLQNSLPFTFYFLSPSLPPLFYIFLTLVLKIQQNTSIMKFWGPQK